MSSILASVWDALASTWAATWAALSALTTGPPRTVMLVGLDAAGKTSLSGLLVNGRFSAHPPTIQASSHDVTVGSLTLHLIDLGGHEQARQFWAEHSFAANAVIFMVDAADPGRFDTAAQELQGLLTNTALDDCPVLILGNKIDIPDAVDSDELARALGLAPPPLDGHAYGIFMCSLKARQGLVEAFDWLSSQL